MATPRSGTSDPDTFLPLVPVPRTPRRPWVRFVMIGSSVLLIAAGFVAGALPVLPGFVFSIVGLLLLGVSVTGIGRWINRQEAKLSPKWRRRLRPKRWRKGRRKLQKLR
jgi:membrane protein DedA with SNARE-associated domain